MKMPGAIQQRAATLTFARCPLDITSDGENGDMTSVCGARLCFVFLLFSFKGVLVPRTGFLRALWLTLRMKEGGLLHAGPPCSSFVWINSSTHRRTRERPLGSTYDYVRSANVTLVLTMRLARVE